MRASISTRWWPGPTWWCTSAPPPSWPPGAPTPPPGGGATPTWWSAHSARSVPPGPTPVSGPPSSASCTGAAGPGWRPGRPSDPTSPAATTGGPGVAAIGHRRRPVRPGPCGRAQRTGLGADIDYSMQSHVAAMLEAAFIAWTYPGFNADRMGVRTLNPWGIFRARDGLVFLVCVEQDQWERLVELMGDPEWADSELFATAAARNEVADALFGLVESFTEQHTVEHLWHEGQRRRIAFAPVFSMADLARQPQLRERGWFATVDQPGLGPIELPGQPAIVHPTGTPTGTARWALRAPAPALGAGPAPSWPARPAAPQAAPPATDAAPPRPLEGVRVLDFSWVWAGPFCTLQLAHLGADVIKVENPARLCLGRRLPFHPPGVDPTVDTSGYFNQWNQAKRSISLDLAHPDGLALARRLAADADVVVDNFAVGVMERLGLGEAALRELNPDVIVASVSGYGQTGALRSYMGYGPTTAPLSGIASLTGYFDGDGPRELGIAFGDPAAGIACAWSIVAALVARRRGAGASRIDTSLWEATAVNGGEGWMHWLLRGEEAPRRGNRHPSWAPHNCYRCADDPPDRSNGPDAGDFVTIAVTDDDQWAALRRAVDPDGTAGLHAERFATADGRKANEDELDALLGDLVRHPYPLGRHRAAAGRRRGRLPHPVVPGPGRRRAPAGPGFPGGAAARRRGGAHPHRRTVARRRRGHVGAGGRSPAG
ncbi:MAG: CoA transferase [Acidimicrobiales bacterium]